MKLPKKYSNLDYKQKKNFVEKIIELYGDESLKHLKNSDEFGKDYIEFIFSYIFYNEEQRVKTWDELEKKYDTLEMLLQGYIQKLYKMGIETNEFYSELKDKNDIESLENQILSL